MVKRAIIAGTLGLSLTILGAMSFGLNGLQTNSPENLASEHGSVPTSPSRILASEHGSVPTSPALVFSEHGSVPT